MTLPIILFAGMSPQQKDALRKALEGVADPRFESRCQELTERVFSDNPALILIGSGLQDCEALGLAEDIARNLPETGLFLLVPAESPLIALDQPPTGIAEIWVDCGEADLCRRVLAHFRYVQRIRDLCDTSTENMRVAMTAMSSMGELGVVMRFLSDCFHRNSYGEVADAVLESLSAWSLSGCCLIRGHGFSELRCTEGEEVEKNGETMVNLCEVGRILEFKSRMIVNYPNASVLVTNVAEDPETHGRFRDNIAMLAEGAQARITSLALEQENFRRREGIGLALQEIREMGAEFAMAQQEALNIASAAINATLADMGRIFLALGLSDQQEGSLLDLVASLRARIDTFHETGTNAMARLETIALSLRELEE